MIEYLCEIETKFENTLAWLSGAQIGSNHEKNGGRKSRDTLPLTEGNKVKLYGPWSYYFCKFSVPFILSSKSALTSMIKLRLFYISE